MAMSPEAHSAGSLVLLVVAVGFAGVAVGGYSQGWALASRSDFHQYPYAPPMELRIGLGWWQATSSVSMSGFPGFEMEVDAAKGLGAVTCGAFVVSVLAALYLALSLVAGYCTVPLVYGMEVSRRRKFVLGLVTTVTLATLSIVLYVALAIGLDHEVSKNFQGQHVFARPDWAFMAGMLSACCWGGQTVLMAGEMQYAENFLYYPLVV